MTSEDTPIQSVETPTVSASSGLTLGSLLAAWLPMDQLQMVINSYSQEVAAQLGNAAKALIVDSLKAYGEEIQRILESARPLAEQLQHVREAIEFYNITEEEVLAIFRQYKWMPFSLMTPDFLLQILQSVSNSNSHRRVGAVNELFRDHFLTNDCEHLAELVNSWGTNPRFKPRMKILRDCVCVIRAANGGYNPANLIVPTLIAQIDGILTETLDGKVKHPNSRNLDFKREFAQLTQNACDADIANYFLLDVLFAFSKYGRAVEFYLNRHKVVHGEYIYYGTTPYMLRLFLVLDYLAQLPQ